MNKPGDRYLNATADAFDERLEKEFRVYSNVA